MKYIISYGLLLVVIACQFQNKDSFGGDISEDPLLISQGKDIFIRQCSSCHDFKQKGIGPNLSGVTHSVESSWIKAFISDPSKILSEKDERAAILFEEYKAIMPAFSSLEESEMDALLSYMHTFSERAEEVLDTIPSVTNPNQDTVEYADIAIDLEFICQLPASHKESPLARINKLDCVDGRNFICDLRGNMYELKNGKSSLFFSMAEEVKDFVNEPGLASGLGSFTFHPEFENNGLWYTVHTEPGHTRPADFTYDDSVAVLLQGVITEWTMDNPKAAVFSGKKREILRVDFVTGIHGMQEISFNSSAKKGDVDYGLLYIGLGDGGSTHKGVSHIGNHSGRGIWSSVIRIDPKGDNSQNGKYGIPKDNPYFDKQGMCQEIWAYGFRNPNRITWDAQGNMIVTDIGQAHMEEVNFVTPGGFYGWPIREGWYLLNPFGNQNKIYPLPADDADYKVTYPVVAYDHDDGLAISGGYIAEKGEFLEGKYVYGDVLNGKVFVSDLRHPESAKIERLKIFYNDKETTLREMSGKSRIDLRLGKGCDGNLYVFTKTDGRFYRLKERQVEL